VEKRWVGKLHEELKETTRNRKAIFSESQQTHILGNFTGTMEQTQEKLSRAQYPQNT
jgi:hypothetical protein